MLALSAVGARLEESELETERLLSDFTPGERRSLHHSLEILSGVGSLPQCRQGGSSEKRVDAAKVHLCDLVGYRFARRIAAHVDDQRSPAWPEDTMHLAQGADRIGEILERRAAYDEVEGIGGKRHDRGVAFAEVDLHTGARGILAGDANERATDIKPGDPIATSSTRSPGCSCLAMRLAKSRNSAMFFPVFFAYQVATMPSIPMPLYGLALRPAEILIVHLISLSH
jgi:hypothetical protein